MSLNYIYIDFYLSIKISSINIETMSKTISESPESVKPNDTTIELQLGDIIHISNDVNEQLNDKTFIIDYIDNSKAYLINTDTLEKIR